MTRARRNIPDKASGVRLTIRDAKSIVRVSRDAVRALQKACDDAEKTDRDLSDWAIASLAKNFEMTAFASEHVANRIAREMEDPTLGGKRERSNPRSSRKLDTASRKEREAREESEKLRIDLDQALAKIGELWRRADEDPAAVELLREANATWKSINARLTDALERRRLAEFEWKRIAAPGQINPTDIDPADELAVERALDRRERARREAKAYTDKLQSFFERKEKIPQGFNDLHQAAIDKYKKASEAARKAIRKYEKAYGQSAALSYWRNPSDDREPSARANPEPLPRLALLGAAVEIRTTRSTLKPRGALLLVSEDGRQIVIARPTSRAAISAPSGAGRARGMFEKWAGRKSDRAVRLIVPSSALAFDLGEVKAIRYRSDKWGGRAQLYEHKFDGKATAIADAPRAPRLIRIDGVPARVLVTERGIVG